MDRKTRMVVFDVDGNEANHLTLKKMKTNTPEKGKERVGESEFMVMDRRERRPALCLSGAGVVHEC